MKRPSAKPLLYILVTAWALITLFPLYWMFLASFKPALGLLQVPPNLWPTDLTLDNYHSLFGRAPIARWFANSVLVAAVETALNLFIGSLAGYAFAKLEFRGKNVLFWTLLFTMMIPGIMLTVPMFLMFARLGLVDTYGGLILPGISGAFAIFFMKQFIAALPTELLHAARMDGASEFQTYRLIVLPLCKPALAVLGILHFIGSWNSFLWPLLISQSQHMRTLPVGLATLQQEVGVDYGLLMAGATVAAIPMIALFFALQKYFLEGSTVGALKG